MPHQRPIVELAGLFNLGQRRGWIQPFAKGQIHHCRFRILRIVAPLREDVGDADHGRDSPAVIQKHAVAGLHGANGFHRLGIGHAIPDGLPLALQIVDRVDRGFSLGQVILHKSFFNMIRYCALPAPRCARASLARLMGNSSVTGSTPWRAQNSSIVATVPGAPEGDPPTECWPPINAETLIAIGSGLQTVNPSEARTLLCISWSGLSGSHDPIPWGHSSLPPATREPRNEARISPLPNPTGRR